MSLPFTDNFTAANGTTLTAYNANWKCTRGNANPDLMVINSNAAGPGALTDTVMCWAGDTFNNDQSAQVTVTAISSGNYVGSAVRCDPLGGPTGGTHNGCYFFYSNNGVGDDCQMYVCSANGTETLLGSVGAAGFAVNDVVKLSIIGTTITPTINGSTTGTPGAQTDSTRASGNAGVAAYGSGTGSQLDVFVGDNVSGGGAGDGLSHGMLQAMTGITF